MGEGEKGRHGNYELSITNYQLPITNYEFGSEEFGEWQIVKS